MNAFLEINRKKLEVLMKHIEEYRFKGSYGGDLNLTEIQTTLKSLITEIHRLDRQVNELTNIINKQNEIKS